MNEVWVQVWAHVNDEVDRQVRWHVGWRASDLIKRHVDGPDWRQVRGQVLEQLKEPL